MAYKYLFRPSALRDLDRLDATVRKRIFEKLSWYIQQDDPLHFAHRLTDSALGTYRYRIGDWRVVFDVSGDTIVVLLIDKRSDIYRR